MAHPSPSHDVSEQRVPVAKKSCPNCGSSRLEPFYAQHSVPSHSCLLMDTHQQAVNFPTGELALACCSDCGFIANTVYEASLQAYSSEYEETQHFSDCFNAFAKRLAERWVDRYDLHNKQILEVGCGKGQFLELLCQLGDNRGIGVDPAVAPERLSDDSNSRIEFIAEYYSDKHRSILADAYCCRHTLEHIEETDEFVRLLRRTIGDREDALVLFELPDVTRVLTECAFWDIYYEHCSYFTAGSLARVFRRNHFDLLELELDYDDQYLLLVARPAQGPTDPRLELEDDLQTTIDQVAEFRRRLPDVVRTWQQRIRSFAAEGKRVVLWGGGSKGVAFLTTLGLQSEVDYVVDINPYKSNKFMPGTGHRVIGPDQITAAPPDVVIVMNPIYMNEIGASLDSLGLSPQLLSVAE